MNLYSLTAAYQHIQSLIEDGGENLADTLESLNDAIEVKAVGYAKIIKNLEGQALAIKSEEERLAGRRRSIEGNTKRLKEALEQSMIQTNIKKLKTELFSFNIQKNPPGVEVLKENIIPKNYFIEQEPKLDKKTILQDLKNGVKVPGVEMRQSEGLRIR
ncbi:siphovirus Gp157 family protein [Mesobacillus stamsii]|uniref:Siphovirus Gp157 family protein n=1 Tax=Mesobacillus stamsii TaxID=225347 RepID=A0ABU0FWA3_9BACI|nr:siphovirus Gp157 family protein [Mesobacillus stamsii]MDQ0414193.1 hypothetical protein [Mesobacillus stamsii]